MALVSPGLQLTVTDQSQYVSAAVGTVPLVVLATAQNKTINGALASGTTKANAGVLQVFGSQREIATALGYPTFQKSSAGTPLHGNELNEYGLMAAYSALGLGNRLYAIRADVDLNELTGTSVRPRGEVADGTYWLDLANTAWGIYEWSADTQSFTNKAPVIITSAADTESRTHDTVLNTPTPIASIGSIGSYAVVNYNTSGVTPNNRIFYKAGAYSGSIHPNNNKNTWTLVGSTGWQNALPTVVGTPATSATSGETITVNGSTVTVSGTLTSRVAIATAAATAINTAAITGVSADVLNNQLIIFATSNSNSNGTLTLAEGTGTMLAKLGLAEGTFYAPGAQYGSYAEVPAWNAASTTARANGSVWLKTGALGGGANFVFKKYNTTTSTWTTQAVSIYLDDTDAISNLDRAGGSNIAAGTIYVKTDPSPNHYADQLGFGGYRAYIRAVEGAVKCVANETNPVFANANATFSIETTQPGSSTMTYAEVAVGSSAAAFVANVLAANIPNISAQVEATGAISLTHLAGGNIILKNISTDVLTEAGFAGPNVANLRFVGTDRVISGFANMQYTYSIATPYNNPVDGTLWYYNDAASVDIMINDGTSWVGYQNLSSDARGYNLGNTDPAGVIVTATKPTAQTDNTALVQGDLWLDTSDLENYPKISRYNGSTWVAIDNTDQISQNGIVFADARWDTDGTKNPVTGSLPAITDLLVSDYVDLDAPDARLYPRGMILFNTRRSGYNVKRFVSNYFNAETFTGSLPAEAGSWVSASGNQNNGAMYAGHKAQRQIIATAMQAAIDSNTQIREDQFQFNLIAAPGYPELIDNMVALNNDRANTAFVIGDTPMTMSTNVVELTNWSNGVTEGGLTTADPYLGVYYPSGITNDVQGNAIMVPPSHMALRTFIHSDNVSFPWFAPAGTRRGLVDNAVDLGYLSTVTGEFVRTGVNQALRDSLYSININPVTIMTGTGIVVWGQKTRNPVASAMDRVNVARLVNYIRTILAKSGNGFLFEPNDKITRDQLKQIIESAMNDLVAKRGIYDYLVVCDTSNNTPDRIARNELYVDVAIEPMKDVEFIYIPIRLMNPGAIAGLGK